MSNQTTGGGTPPQTSEALAAEIEQTRHELGETVEALVAKTDVKARAQHKAAEVTENLRGKAQTAAGKVRERARGAQAMARAAQEKAARRVPALRSSGATGAYGAAAALAAAAIILGWPMIRRRRQ
jgi:acetylornithine deacetylase/succinyl-diaminopimelate desuccinylase-like protein